MTRNWDKRQTQSVSLSFAQSEVLFAFAKLLLQSCSGIPGWKMSPAILGKTVDNWLESHEQGVEFSWRQQHL